MTEPLYNPQPRNPRRNWLLRYIGVQEKYDHQINVALQDAAAYAEHEINKRSADKRIGASTRSYQLQLARKTTRGIVKEIFQDLKSIIGVGQSDAAVAATEAGLYVDRRVLTRLFPDRTKRAKFEESMTNSASRGVQAMMTRIIDTHIPLSQQVYRTEALANGYLDRVVNTSLAAGDSATDIARRVRDSIRPDTPGGVSYAAKRLGRTEINNAFHAQSIADVQLKPWIDYVTWNLSKMHVPQQCRCEDYARQSRFPKENIPRKPHPQCVVGNTLIEFPGARLIAATSRRHEGQFVKIKTAMGRDLTVTPNHPILTTTGMIPATMLSKGSRIIDSGPSQRESFGAYPYPQQRPALAKDVFASFNESLLMSSSAVKTMSEDFHGDASEGDIAIVRSNIQTENRFRTEIFGERAVNFANATLIDEVGLGSSTFLFERNFPSANSFIRCSNRFLAPFGSFSVSPYSLGGGDASNFNSLSNQPLAESKAFDGKLLGPADFIWRNSRKVEVDEIISVVRFESSQDVYNFQTTTGWYRSNNIVSKNCMCYIAAQVAEWEEFKSNLLAGIYNGFVEEHS